MGAALGALAALSAGLAPNAVADDVQLKQWYLDAMNADQLWKVSTGKGIKIAVVDSGVNPATPSLKGQVLTAEVPKSVAFHATKDFSGHGTTIAELIAGTGAGGGLKGLAPGSKIVPYRVKLASLKGASEIKRTPDPVQAIRAAADSDAQIINMSFGADTISPGEQKAIEYAASKGKLMFAAVGNNAQEKNSAVEYPAAYPYVVGVAASDKSGSVGDFSAHGRGVDLAAPGLDVPRWCDTAFRSYCGGAEGTSAASAIASASAALIWSAHPNWTANQVSRVLLDTAGRDWPKDAPSKYLGYGLIRPSRSLLHGEGKPGAANVDPVSNERTSTGSSDAGATPSASVPASSQPPKSTSGGETSAAGSSAKSSDDNDQLWIVLGAVAAVVVLGGGAFAMVRARRSG
ncbi:MULTISPECIES: S8 family serine peptidase [unclassified Streptomyces]|uniref:S8 family serine peptidase n=1 Tax=unclassified Streptomyces TaxID=2593676 RepID=UPI0036E9057E